MNEFIRLPPEEQRHYYQQASAKLNLPAAAIEKDFWVCWTLDSLFRLPEWRNHLTFKGGTSLSKVWKLIARFSEDIDITLSRDFIGFDGENDPEGAETRSQKQARMKRLKKIARERVERGLLPELQSRVATDIPHGAADWVSLDTKDTDHATIAFNYPMVTPRDSLGPMLPYVKIEMGPRGDSWPTHEHQIEPYLVEALPGVISAGEGISVRVLDAERTFLEKAMLLHEETFRPPDRTRKPRMARHYYDIYCMIRAGVGGRAIDDPALFKRVREHRRFYYTVSWVDYESMVPGSICLVPDATSLLTWKKDYDEMRNVFFFGEAPLFDQIMEAVEVFQADWNACEL